jgi:hypothetical protein
VGFENRTESDQPGGEGESHIYGCVWGSGPDQPCENVFLLYVDTTHSIWSHKYCSG